MRIKKTMITVGLLGASLLSATAMASTDRGVYIEGLAGLPVAHESGYGSDTETGNQVSFAAGLGYQFGKHWGAELGGTVLSEKVNSRSQSEDPKSVTGSLYFVHLAARLTMPLNQRIAIFSKLGVGDLVGTSVGNSLGDSASTFTLDGIPVLYIGLGVNVGLTEHVFLTGQASGYVLPVVFGDTSGSSWLGCGLVGGGLSYHF